MGAVKTPRPDRDSTSAALASSALEPPLMSCASEAERGINPEMANKTTVAATRDLIDGKAMVLVLTSLLPAKALLRRSKVYCDLTVATSFRVTQPKLAFAVLPTFNDSMIYRVCFVFITGAVLLSALVSARNQDFLPTPPPDKTLVYTLNERNVLTPLAFETGSTPLKVTEKAKSTRTSYVEIAGPNSSTTLSSNPRLFLYTAERQGSHPPFIVWLTAKRGARRATAIVQAGMTGYGIASEEIVKPNLRVLAKSGDEVFIELRPRTSLVPGEYAIIGDDLTRIATFRVEAESPR